MIDCDTAFVEPECCSLFDLPRSKWHMNNRLFGALAIAALIFVGGAAIGIGAYNAGVAQGIAESGRMIAAPPAGTPYVYVWPRPWGFGFFPFFPILFFLLFFFVVRGLLWRGRWHGRYRYDGVPPMFEEWHRRAHAGPSSATGTASTAPERNRAE
jgi:hypothetical protein